MRTHPNRIPIATAAEVAAKLPYPHTVAGGWYRTSTAICHGGDSKSALAFCDSERPGDSPLRVYCHSHNCDAIAIRHALQQATGLWLCRCDACFAAFRAGQPPPGATATPFLGATSAQNGPKRTNRRSDTQNAQNAAQNRSGPAQGGDTNAYAARLWAAAQPSTTGPAPHHPVARWLAQRDLWPVGKPLPESVRWLARSHTRFPCGRPESTAAGALVMAMRPLDDPTAPPRKVQLVTVDSAGRKAHHWQPDKGGDKRTYGTGPAYGLLWRERPDGSKLVGLHAVEGLADGLAILSMLLKGNLIVAVCAGTGYSRIEAGWFSSVTLWPDSDDEGQGIKAARQAAQLWANRGYTNIKIKQLPEGHDPASIQWRSQ